MHRQADDWARIADELAAGNSLAFLKVSRRVTGYLAGWRAYDFKDDWSDVVQEVAIALIEVVRSDTLRDRSAVLGYIKMATRNKFIDRIRRQKRQKENQLLPWEEECQGIDEPGQPPELSTESLIDLEHALEQLPERERDVVWNAYAVGMTYREVSDVTGIPLGTVKRLLRDALRKLRGELSS